MNGITIDHCLVAKLHSSIDMLKKGGGSQERKCSTDSIARDDVVLINATNMLLKK